MNKMAEADPAKVLVTGASGYIASHVVQQLLEDGHVVRGTVRSLNDERKVQNIRDLFPQAADKLELVEAELMKADTWLSAVEGMDYVIHLASPFPLELPEAGQEDTLIKPAVEGTLHVLKACEKTPSVRRVVLTGSATAVNWSLKKDDKVYSEEDWSDVKTLNAHDKGKFMAEKAAWDFIQRLPAERNLQLAVINPSMTMGPPLQSRHCTSTLTVQRLLDRAIPGLPKMNFPIADVRDVALAHLRAMTVPEAAGQRHIVCNGNLWMSDMAQLLKCVFGPQGYDIPTVVVPNMLLRVVGKLDGSLQVILPYLGLVHKYDNSRMQKVLGVEPRNLRDTIIEMAHAMIQKAMVKQTTNYLGPRGKEEKDAYMAVKF